VIHGGTNGTVITSDVEELNGAGTAWTALSPSGTAPYERAGHAAIYDAPGDRMILFGGQGYAGAVFNDVWALQWDNEVPIVLSAYAVEVDPGRVHIVWYAADARDFEAVVLRSVSGGDWAPVGRVRPDGSGFLAFEDREITPGASLAYCLETSSGEGVRR